MPFRQIQFAFALLAFVLIAFVAVLFSSVNAQGRFLQTNSPVESPPVFRVQAVVHAEIDNCIEKELRKMGVWEPAARQFCHERSYTTMQRMLFMSHLRAIKGVKNFPYLIYRATMAYDESEGLACELVEPTNELLEAAVRSETLIL